MEDLRRSDGTDVASLLGYVAAHEIGHLLLGTNSHAVAGIMHAHWTAGELTSTKLREMVFLASEAREMKERLITAAQISKAGSQVVGVRAGKVRNASYWARSRLLGGLYGGAVMNWLQGRRGVKNSHLSLGDAKANPFRAVVVRRGFAGT